MTDAVRHIRASLEKKGGDFDCVVSHRLLQCVVLEQRVKTLHLSHDSNNAIAANRRKRLTFPSGVIDRGAWRRTRFGEKKPLPTKAITVASAASDSQLFKKAEATSLNPSGS